MPASHSNTIRRTLLLALAALLLIGAYALSFHLIPREPQARAEQSALPAISAAAGQPAKQEKPAGDKMDPIAVEGWVTDARNGEPVQSARVHLAGLTTETDAKGHFVFSKNQLSPSDKSSEPEKIPTVDVEVSSPGYARWKITGARYIKGDTLRLYSRLETADHPAITVAAAQPQQGGVGTAETTTGGLGGALFFESPGNTANAFANAAVRTPPATIRVYRTDTSQVEVVPFRDYVKHVLPNEWIPTWNPESLKAGAMAVKSYAWYWISLGGKQKSLGADVKDNVEDQVYDPNVSYASTDAAVDATFNYSITLNGALFQTQYCAGSYGPNSGGDCPWSNLYMTQWGSAWHADHGRPWGWILQYYYTDAVITPAPPGGGYVGTPVPRVNPTSVPTPPSLPDTGVYTVGQGSDRADLFQEAYDRNGGAAALGAPMGPVKWWLTYVTEFNLHAQRFSGPDGRGNIWIVYDTLKASSQGVHKAFVLSGDIAAAYASHTPPGPEWVGAPTSDPYTSAADSGSVRSQGFTNGTLAVAGGSVQFTPWPQTFNGWKAEFFAGHDQKDGATFGLLGQPSLVRDLPAPSFDWTASPDTAASMAAGNRDWSVQFTKYLDFSAGSYDFSIGTTGGVSVWLDGALAVDSWQVRQAYETLAYSANLTAGSHRVRIQFWSATAAAKLQFAVAPEGQQVPQTVAAAPPAAPAAPATSPAGSASLRIQVQWLGRGASPSDRWVLPLTLQLSAPGNPAIVGTYKANTDRNGVGFFNNLPAGIYDVHAKGPHSLQSARASIGIQSGSTVDLDMKAQVEGDVDGDNCVTPMDLEIVQGMLGASSDTPGFQAGADLNGDGSVTMADLSLLRSGFDLCGDISADDQFRIMSANSGPSLSEALSPWLNPASLQHTLTMSVVPSANSARRGDIITVAVRANAGSQPVDGAAFVIHYDPQRLLPVDASGNPARNPEPGLLLPAVMGSWIDAKSGAVGYSSGMVQGDPPTGVFTVATLRLKVLPGAQRGATTLDFMPLPSGYMQITNGGENLLARVTGASITIKP